MKLLILLLFAGSACAGQPGDLRAQLEAANAALSRAHLDGDAGAIAQRYTDDAVLMPEHDGARRGQAAVADYYRQWFAGVTTTAFRRDIHEVLDYGDTAIETGTFAQTFHTEDAVPFDYAGKYMTVWATDDDAPRVLSELWGANAPFDDAAFPRIADAMDTAEGESSNDATVASELATRNATIRRLVMERKGSEHARLFLPDAIYMTYYTPMLVGIDAIHGYFVEHEKPGSLSIEALELRSDRIRPIDDGRLQLEQGFYRVAWRDGDASGTVTGKSLNLWKKDANGTWMLFRQAVNHD
ncbi:MAG: nuclear transport factor 2 family protein [Pseudoxanthomonas sp.]